VNGDDDDDGDDDEVSFLVLVAFFLRDFWRVVIVFFGLVRNVVALVAVGVFFGTLRCILRTNFDGVKGLILY